jgi:hypothetical protein
MKRMMCVLSIVVGLMPLAPAPVVAVGEDARSVTGAAAGLFGAGATLGAVAIESVELGTGVFIEADGSASGTFHAVLRGSSLGIAQQITLEGKVSEGSVSPEGRATFSGTASLDVGDGGPPLAGVAFSVTAAPDGLVLTIASTPLPAAGLTTGALTID